MNACARNGTAPAPATPATADYCPRCNTTLKPEYAAKVPHVCPWCLSVLTVRP